MQKPLWVHVLVGLGLLMGVVFLFFSLLGVITRHGEDEKVPSVMGLTSAEATKKLEGLGFRVEVLDSVWVDTAAAFSVLKQSPEADMMVKRNRTVFLTIRRGEAPLIEMPDLKGFSFRSAELYLQNLGLVLGDTTFKPDIAQGAVLEQLYNNQPLAPGTKVPMGARIGFTLGSGVGNTSTNVPDLLGMTLAEARSYLQGLNLSISTINEVVAVTDKENAFVQKQNPEPYTLSPEGSKRYNKIRPGQLIDLWIGPDKPLPRTDAPATVPNAEPIPEPTLTPEPTNTPPQQP